MSKRRRCAIYTRKSTEEGLEQAFNSLDAQREACAAYIASQRHEGWSELPTHYDDGGFSGGSMERPALARLLGDVERGEVDVVIVYKVDRLTRSLADFARIVAIFDAAGVSFVSVTQQFNTTTSMGRLTLNVLLSFAQFEREVTAERIRDKVAASKQKGMWMGGVVPIGYRAEARRLVIEPMEADLVRRIFERYLALGSVRKLQAELVADGCRTPLRVSRSGRQSGGCVFSRGKLYWLLSNPVMVGRIRHRDKVYPGQHEPIIDFETWDRTQRLLAENRRHHEARANATDPSPLAAKLFDPVGKRMRPTHAKKGSKRYRYYVSPSLIDSSVEVGALGWRVPAAEIERALAHTVRAALTDPSRRSAIVADVEAPAGIKSTLDRLDRLIADLRDPTSQEGKTALSQITQRIALSETELEAEVDLVALLGVEDEPAPIRRLALKVSAPIRIDRRGASMRLVLRGATDESSAPDPQLVQTVIAARRRFAAYTRQPHPKSVIEIAANEATDPGDVSRSLQLAFLAPDLLEAILDGQQPAALTATRLRRLDTLPLLWSEQRAVLS